MDHKSYIQFIIVMLMRFNLIFGLFRFIFGSFPVIISWIKLRKVLYIYIEEHLCLIPSILGTSGALEWMLIGSKVGILNFSGTLGGHFQYPSSSSHVGYRFRPPWTDLSKKKAQLLSLYLVLIDLSASRSQKSSPDRHEYNPDDSWHNSDDRDPIQTIHCTIQNWG